MPKCVFNKVVACFQNTFSLEHLWTSPSGLNGLPTYNHSKSMITVEINLLHLI